MKKATKKEGSQETKRNERRWKNQKLATEERTGVDVSGCDCLTGTREEEEDTKAIADSATVEEE